MNYSNKTSGGKYMKVKRKKFPRYRKHYLSFCTYFIVGILFGGFVAWGLVSKDAAPVEPTVMEESMYGTIDGRHITEEISLKWGSEMEQGFVPLDVPMDEDMQEFIYCLSHGYSIDFPFVMAVIEHESSFVSDAASTTGDYGLMQINEINHEWLIERLGVTDFNDPYQNTRCGIFILRNLFEKYEDPAKVLIAYNMGETGASKLWEKGVFETHYSRAIMEQAAEYEQQISERKGHYI